MPRLFLLNLSLEDREKLEAIIARGVDWRQRQRAQTLMNLDNGMSPAEAAQALGIHARTVAATRKDWFKRGFDSLRDRPRSGAPRKLTPEQIDTLIVLASAQPLTSRQLLAKHVDSGGAPVHLNTLTAALKAAGLVWKRTRHSLKKTK